MKRTYVTSLIIRYGILLALGASQLFLGENGIFYKIFTPLTLYPVSLVLKALYGAELILPNIILLNEYHITLVPACIAGAAYFLLAVLTLATPLPIKKQIAVIAYLFGAFLILNIARIVLFSALFYIGYSYFDIAHRIIWYAGSTLLVILLWFSAVALFRMRAVPALTDIKTLRKQINSHKKSND